MMARKLPSWGLAILVSLFMWWGAWRLCDRLFTVGKLDGTYLTEEKLLPVLNDCRERLTAFQQMSESCDTELFDCKESLRFVEGKPIAELLSRAPDTGSRGHPL